MAQAFTKRFAAVNQSGPFTVDAVVVPAGRRYVIRDLSVFIAEPGAFATIAVQSGSLNFAIAFFEQTPTLFQHLSLRQALNAGDKLQISGTSGNFQIAVTGYDLSES